MTINHTMVLNTGMAVCTWGKGPSGPSLRVKDIRIRPVNQQNCVGCHLICRLLRLRVYTSFNSLQQCMQHEHVCVRRCPWQGQDIEQPYSLGQKSSHKTETCTFRHRLHSHSSSSVSVRLSTARQLTQLAAAGMSATESRCSALEVPLITAVLSH